MNIPPLPLTSPSTIFPSWWALCGAQADQSQWVLARKMSETATVVIVNGVFINGFVPFEPVYYFKNISGWGSVVRQYPGDFTAYLAGTNEVVGQVHPSW